MADADDDDAAAPADPAADRHAGSGGGDADDNDDDDHLVDAALHEGEHDADGGEDDDAANAPDDGGVESQSDPRAASGGAQVPAARLDAQQATLLTWRDIDGMRAACPLPALASMLLRSLRVFQPTRRRAAWTNVKLNVGFPVESVARLLLGSAVDGVLGSISVELVFPHIYAADGCLDQSLVHEVRSALVRAADQVRARARRAHARLYTRVRPRTRMQVHPGGDVRQQDVAELREELSSCVQRSGRTTVGVAVGRVLWPRVAAELALGDERLRDAMVRRFTRIHACLRALRVHACSMHAHACMPP
jgi:hypothetical protein